MSSKHESQRRMKETEARNLAEEINKKKLRVQAEPISARHYGYWNVKLTHEVERRTITIMTAAEWAQFCEMWGLQQQQQKEGADEKSPRKDHQIEARCCTDASGSDQ